MGSWGKHVLKFSTFHFKSLEMKIVYNNTKFMVSPKPHLNRIFLLFSNRTCLGLQINSCDFTWISRASILSESVSCAKLKTRIEADHLPVRLHADVVGEDRQADELQSRRTLIPGLVQETPSWDCGGFAWTSKGKLINDFTIKNVNLVN